MICALDLDNVCLGIIASARAVMSLENDIPIDEIRETGLYPAPFTHADPARAALLQPTHAFWNRDDVLLAAPPLPGAVNAAHRLAQAGKLACYVTRRPPSVERPTAASMLIHGFPRKPILFVGSANESETFAVCKSMACLRFGVTHMIDDQPHEAETLLAAGINVVLVDAPIGRLARHEFLRANPHVPVAADLSAAVDMLLNPLPEVRSQ